VRPGRPRAIRRPGVDPADVHDLVFDPRADDATSGSRMDIR
jgi:hypothetical protein